MGMHEEVEGMCRDLYERHGEMFGKGDPKVEGHWVKLLDPLRHPYRNPALMLRIAFMESNRHNPELQPLLKRLAACLYGPDLRCWGFLIEPVIGQESYRAITKPESPYDRCPFQPVWYYITTQEWERLLQPEERRGFLKEWAQGLIEICANYTRNRGQDWGVDLGRRYLFTVLPHLEETEIIKLLPYLPSVIERRVEAKRREVSHGCELHYLFLSPQLTPAARLCYWEDLAGFILGGSEEGAMLAFEDLRGRISTSSAPKECWMVPIGTTTCLERFLDLQEQLQRRIGGGRYVLPFQGAVSMAIQLKRSARAAADRRQREVLQKSVLRVLRSAWTGLPIPGHAWSISVSEAGQYRELAEMLPEDDRQRGVILLWDQLNRGEYENEQQQRKLFRELVIYTMRQLGFGIPSDV